MKTEIVEDLEDQRELYETFMPDDTWVGDDHTFWQVKSAAGTIVAMCSAVYRPRKGYVYLSSAGVDPAWRGAGLQRRMVQLRLRWAKKQGAIYAVTYTALNNHASIYNLLRCGFRMAEKPRGWLGVWGTFHYFEKVL